MGLDHSPNRRATYPRTPAHPALQYLACAAEEASTTMSKHRDFQRVAVLNRGEPAIRFLRALREYNFERGTSIKAVALYTEPDQEAPFVRLADEMVSLGPVMRPGPEGQVNAYCHHEHVLAALKRSRCDALWPGWGFVSEDPVFVKALEEAGIVFLGPSSEAMFRLGDKIASKQLAEECDVPLAPWHWIKPEDTEDVLYQEAERIGYPLMVKASAGGGGRGIRKVTSKDELLTSIQSARQEVEKVFGQGGLFMESCITGARHIEVQLVAGVDGVAKALGVRDCSIQRRNQKVIEEAPSPVLPEEMQELLCKSAVRLAEKAGYCGVGTAEFLYQPARNRAAFLEVNSRLQVEHTVTEVQTGCDIVKAQIDIARGLPWEGGNGATLGHVIEVRLNAEDPERGFAPSPGVLRVFRTPSGPGIRVDSGFAEGQTIAPEFDSMLAKVIAWGPTRKQAIARLVRALEEFQVVVEDGATNKAFLMKLLQTPEYVEGTADTSWLDRAVVDSNILEPTWEFEALLLAAIVEYRLQWHVSVQKFFAEVMNGIPQDIPGTDGLNVNLRLRGQSHKLDVYALEPDHYLVGPPGALHSVTMEPIDEHTAMIHINGRRHHVLYAYGRTGISVEVDDSMHIVERASGGVAKAPAPAVVVHIAVSEGDYVEPGDLLCTLEVMKMEMLVRAQEAGHVREISCQVNEQVQAGQPLVVLEVEGDTSSKEAADTSHHEASPRPWDALFEGDNPIPERLDQWDEDTAAEAISALTQQFRSIFQGFDVPPDLGARLEQLLGQELAFTELEHPERWKPLVYSLKAFTEVESLFDRHLLPRHQDVASLSAELDFYEFCRNHHDGEEGAQEALRPFLREALSGYGVHSLDPSEALRDSILRLIMGHSNTALRHHLCSALLRMLMGLYVAGVHFDEDDELSTMLRQINMVAKRKYPSVRDNARQAQYVLFDQSRYVKRRQVVAEWLVEHQNAIRKIADKLPARPDPHNYPKLQEILEELVDSRHSWLPLLLKGSEPTAPEMPYIMQAVVRRFYAATDLDMIPTDLEDPEVMAAQCMVRCDGELKPVLVMCCLPHHLRHSLSMGRRFLENRKQLFPINVELIVIGDDKPCLYEEVIEQSVHAVGMEHTGLTRLTMSWCNGRDRLHHRTYHWKDYGLEEIELLRDIHPEAANRIELHRLQEFHLERLESPEQLYAFRTIAKTNPKDTRIFVFAEIHDFPRDLLQIKDDNVLWEFEQRFFESLRVIREMQAMQTARHRYHLNRLTLYIRPMVHLDPQSLVKFVQRFEPATRGLGLQKVVLHVPVIDHRAPLGFTRKVMVISKRGRHRLETEERQPSRLPIRAMTPYDMKVVRSQRRGYIYPYEIAYLLEGRHISDHIPHPDMVSGRFVEYDLDESGETLAPTIRPRGQNEAGVVVGIISNKTAKFPDGMERVWIASDPTFAMGALAEPECRRVLAAIDMAEEKKLPIEWLPISAGAKIAMDSGTENLDWTARVLKRIVAFTQQGGEINLIVTGVNVGAQSYWNAEATMLMHTRGVLIMTPEASMVLTGKKALDYSGGVSAENERGIGGFERIMGPNGQAQYFAQDLGEAYSILFEYYRYTYVKPGETLPRANRNTLDAKERSVLTHKYERDTEPFSTIGDIFDPAQNPGRKKPFAIREVMNAVKDQDSQYLERYQAMRHADTAVTWETHIGGYPVSLIGFESRPLVRRSRVPMDGPDVWTGGTLFPQSSKKVAFSINAASGNRPVVILANLSGFDGSPESLRKLQLEMGAEIGRAVVNFEGPIIFVVIGRYHGGAYVVFSKALNPQLTAMALEGTYASVIGGAPAAAVVFPHEVRKRTEKDPRIQELQQKLAEAPDTRKPILREQLESMHAQIFLEKQGEVAREFDAIHTVERAVQQGSLDRIIAPATLRPSIIEILEDYWHAHRSETTSLELHQVSSETYKAQPVQDAGTSTLETSKSAH